MDIEYNVNDENRKVLEEICEKYGYSEELKSVLSRVMPAMLEGATYEERELFYSMLRKTQIEIIPAESTITRLELSKKHLGGINPHIINVEADTGEYGKNEPAGGFVRDAELDENLKIKGVRQYLFVRELSEKNEKNRRAIDLLGTKINVSHLIHELGHAWVSEKNGYEIDDSGTLTERVGTCKIKYQITPLENGKYERREISRTGLMLEEALNTNMEEESLARYLGISKEKTQLLYKSSGCLDKSLYQGLMSEMSETLTERTMEKNLRNWRIVGDERALEELNSVMMTTNEYQNREMGNEYFKDKVEFFEEKTREGATGEILKRFLLRCKNDFFPNKKDMTPMEIIEATLRQCYDVKANQLTFDLSTEEKIEEYKKFVRSVIADGYLLINETRDYLKDKGQDLSK